MATVWADQALQVPYLRVVQKEPYRKEARSINNVASAVNLGFWVLTSDPNFLQNTPPLYIWYIRYIKKVIKCMRDLDFLFVSSRNRFLVSKKGYFFLQNFQTGGLEALTMFINLVFEFKIATW